MKQDELRMGWEAIVDNFTEASRVLEHLVETRHNQQEREKAFGIMWGYAERLDKQKKEDAFFLFGTSENYYDAQYSYEPGRNITDHIADLSSRFYNSQDMSKCRTSRKRLQRQSEAQKEIRTEGKDKVQELPFFIEESDSFVRDKIVYLQDYFGIAYDDQNWSQEQWFQVHQLLLILVKCEAKKTGILRRIREASFWRFRHEEGNPYWDFMQFIRRELLKSISFQDAVTLEYFAGTLRFCTNTLADAIVSRVTDENSGWCHISTNEVRNDLYPLILKRLKELNTSVETDFKKPEDLFIRAYLHFLLLSIDDELQEPRLEIDLSLLYKEKPDYITPFVEEKWKESRFSDNQAKNPVVGDVNTAAHIHWQGNFELVESFVVRETSKIVSEIWRNDSLVNRTESEMARLLKNRKQNIKRHSKGYAKVALLFLFYNRRKPPFVISLNELLGLIYLYEKCQFAQLTKRTGYNGGKNEHRDKTFTAIIGDLGDNIPLSIVFRDVERGWYEISCFMNTLNLLLDNATENGRSTSIEIKKELVRYLKKVIPVLGEESRIYRDITEIGEGIISTGKLRSYHAWKKKQNDEWSPR